MKRLGGIMRFLNESKYNNLPKISTVQNPYSLLNRQFEVGSAEVCMRENVGLFAYSPMAFGVLSGKFLTGESHPNARIKLFPQFSRYNSAQSTAAAAQYVAIAKKHDLSPAQMALAFVTQQPFVTSNIIGATTLEQLKENIASMNVVLSDEIIKEINAVHAVIPDPAP